MNNNVKSVIKWTVKQVSNPLSSTPFSDVPFVSEHYFDRAKDAISFMSNPTNNTDNAINSLSVIMNFTHYDENNPSNKKPEPLLIPLSVDESGKWAFPDKATYKKGSEDLPVPALLISEIDSCY